MDNLQNIPILVPLFSFILIALASRYIGKLFSSFGLPYITGYLLTGMLAGPFLLGMMPSGATDELRFIDQLSLAVIAFIAGSELYLKEIRNQLRTILLNTAGIVVAALILIGGTIFALSNVISFTDGFGTTEQIAMAVLGATVLLALSPASTIAVIQEVRAKGPFSKTVLSVAVVMDVVIIVLFAIAAAFATTLIDGSSLGLTFAGLLLADIILAVIVGLLVGSILSGVLSTNINGIIKAGLILLIGLGLFTASFYVDQLAQGIHMEPLLSAMIAGFFVTNYTKHRREFESILHDVSPAVYVAFFTLTGVAVKLDVLVATGGIAIILFFARMLAIFVGSYAGGTLAGESVQFRRLAWAGLITQAGIALGLARQVAVDFPDTLGDAFATMIIAVIVLNEIFGPMLLKWALNRSGESQLAGQSNPDDVRAAVIFGIEGQSLALARQLSNNNWQVRLADTDRKRIELVQANSFEIHHISDFSADCVSKVVGPGTDAVIAMLDDDNANLQTLEIAYEKFGIDRLIVRINNLAMTEAFTGIGAKVVDPTMAMVNVLDQFVRVPQSAALMLHQDPDYDIIQVTVTEKGVDGVLLRDLRLPEDVLVLEISRKGQNIVPNGHTRLRRKDEVVLVGKTDSLKKTTLQLGF